MDVERLMIRRLSPVSRAGRVGSVSLGRPSALASGKEGSGSGHLRQAAGMYGSKTAMLWWRCANCKEAVSQWQRAEDAPEAVQVREVD
jgi:hypothetical protein